MLKGHNFAASLLNLHVSSKDKIIVSDNKVEEALSISPEGLIKYATIEICDVSQDESNVKLKVIVSDDPELYEDNGRDPPTKEG